MWQDADDEGGEAGVEVDDDDDGDDEEDGDGDKEDVEDDEDEQEEAPKRQKVELQLMHADNPAMVPVHAYGDVRLLSVTGQGQRVTAACCKAKENQGCW